MFRTEQDKQAYLGYADRSIHPQNLCVLNGIHHAIPVGAHMAAT